MNLKLEENKDFVWEVVTNRFGYERKAPSVNGNLLEGINEPSRDSVVYMNSENTLIPVLIKDGQYLVDGRLSNSWSWFRINDDFTLGDIESGYGDFYRSPYKFFVHKTLTVGIE